MKSITIVYYLEKMMSFPSSSSSSGHRNDGVESQNLARSVGRRATDDDDMQQDRNQELVRRRDGLLKVPPRRMTLPSAAAITGSGGGENGHHPHPHKKLSRLLLNVNIQNSLGPVQVVMSPDNTVKDLIKAAIDIYVKEKRRPFLPHNHPSSFQLHYSQFTLESLKQDEELMKLGSRNFFMCPKPSNINDVSAANNEAEEQPKFPFPLTKFMDFML